MDAHNSSCKQKEERAKFQLGGSWWSWSLVKMFTRQWVGFLFRYKISRALEEACCTLRWILFALAGAWSYCNVSTFTLQWGEFSFYFTFLSLVERTSSPHVRLREQTACLGLTEPICNQMVLFK